MDWTQAANIATVAEAIVVTISVMFIAVQLRVQTRLTKAANTQALVELSSPFEMQVTQDRQMAELWVNGWKDYATYDAVDQHRYKSLLIWWLILHENIYYQHQQHLLDAHIYTAWDNDLRGFVKNQHLGNQWPELRDGFQAEFVHYVDTLIAH